MNIYNIYRKLTSQVCCPRDDGKPEWTPWERKIKDVSRPVVGSDNIWNTDLETVSYTKVWQERQCATCGMIQQKDLEY